MALKLGSLKQFNIVVGPGNLSALASVAIIPLIPIVEESHWKALTCFLLSVSSYSPFACKTRLCCILWCFKEHCQITRMKNRLLDNGYWVSWAWSCFIADGDGSSPAYYYVVIGLSKMVSTLHRAHRSWCLNPEKKAQGFLVKVFLCIWLSAPMFLWSALVLKMALPILYSTDSLNNKSVDFGTVGVVLTCKS